MTSASVVKEYLEICLKYKTQGEPDKWTRNGYGQMEPNWLWSAWQPTFRVDVSNNPSHAERGWTQLSFTATFNFILFFACELTHGIYKQQWLLLCSCAPVESKIKARGDLKALTLEALWVQSFTYIKNSPSLGLYITKRFLHWQDEQANCKHKIIDWKSPLL